jgi:hypothetical protein
MRWVLLALLLVSCADWSFDNGQYGGGQSIMNFPDNHCTTDEQCKDGAICVKQYGYVGLCAKVMSSDAGKD